MTKPLEEMNSTELKETLANPSATLPEPEREIPDPGGNEAIPHYSRQEFEAMPAQQQIDIVRKARGLPTMEEQAAAKKTAQFGAALGLDMMDLSERYGSNLVDQFAADLQRNKIKMPEGIEKVPNALEHVFREVWLPGQDVSASELGAFLPRTDEWGNLEEPERAVPLHSRSMDALIPDRVRPAPKTRAKEKPMRLPDLSPEDVNEMVGLWATKHPERFR